MPARLMWDATSSQMTLNLMTRVAAVVFAPDHSDLHLLRHWKMFGRITKEHIESNTHLSVLAQGA